ncbi:helix-turn-helix transcriptional regulator [uncultured Clostridium sp.]|uniref:helix-turn-helix domain-containing protein n=1 Tax=uncultured Clostridium sp. TaxID=59620 RepID=UPI002620AD66|nr:helix-turn-helix transcriptional regulator [uncultured Clostridium sp.]
MRNLKIGENILFLRKRNGLTQEELGHKLGITAGAISKWEHGSSSPDIGVLIPLAKALNTTIDDLFLNKNQMTEEEVRNLKKDLSGVFLVQGYDEGKKHCDKILLEEKDNLYLKLAVGSLVQMYGTLGENLTEEIVKDRMNYALELYYEVEEKKDFKYSMIALERIASLEMMIENYEKSEEAIKNINGTSIDPAFLYTILLEKKGELSEAEIMAKKLLMKYLNQTSSMLGILGRLNKSDINKAKKYLNILTDIEEKFNIGMGTGAYQFAKLYMANNENDMAGKWYKKYINEILEAPYDYEKNPYFSGITLEVDKEGQKIVRKSLFKNLVKEDEFKTLHGNKDYDEARKKLELAIEKI